MSAVMSHHAASSSVSSPVSSRVSLAPGRTMRAATYSRYGEPDVLGMEEVDRPTPGESDVLVQVHAAGVTIGDHHIITGKPYLIRVSPFGGLPGPKHRVPGAILSGRVAAVGAKVTEYRVGDEVYGQAANGAFAEYVVLPAGSIALKPTNLSFEQAAAVPWGATALQGLRDAGAVKPGQRVLINGASGAVGTWAVQIGKALGAVVTAVCSTSNVELVRSLGADEVVDYTSDDFVKGGARFDVMFDVAGNRSMSECRSVIVPGGSYVACSGGGGDWVGPMFRVIGGLLASLVSSRKFKMFVMAPRHDDLVFLKELIEAGKAKPIIERCYEMGEVAEALRHVGEGHSRGQSVIRIAS